MEDANSKTNLDILEELTASLLNVSKDINLYQDTLDLLPIGVAIISSRLVTWCNKKTLKLFGYHSMSEVLGCNTQQFYSSRAEFERVGKICYPNGGSTMAIMKKRDQTETCMLIRVQVNNPETGQALVIFCGLEGLKKICARFGKGGCLTVI